MNNTVNLDASKALAFQATYRGYRGTPLQTYKLKGRMLLVKDETNRMGLGAFKALGGIYAVAKLIEAQAAQVSDTKGQGKRRRSIAGQGMTFVCASAGNHGMAVTAGACAFGAKARIHLSETVPESFARRLREKGAEVVRSGVDYEASVVAAIADAESTGAIHLADGSWPGYTEPPRLVMEGYTVMAEEMRASFEASGQWPTHVYLQAGVGGMAAAIAYMIRKNWSFQPKIKIVEPDAAPCLRDSALAGRIVTVDGPVSNMGRLDCKTPSMLALDILKGCAADWVTVTDDEASAALTFARDLGFSTTPSGAAGLAAALREDANLQLVILSEGSVADP